MQVTIITIHHFGNICEVTTHLLLSSHRLHLRLRMADISEVPGGCSGAAPRKWLAGRRRKGGASGDIQETCLGRSLETQPEGFQHLAWGQGGHFHFQTTCQLTHLTTTPLLSCKVVLVRGICSIKPPTFAPSSKLCRRGIVCRSISP